MRDVYKVLREKVDAIEQVRREVEALRSVSPLLTDARSNSFHLAAHREVGNMTSSEMGDALRTVAPLLIDETEDVNPQLRARLIEAGENQGTRRKISQQLRHLAAPWLGVFR
jgi:HEAT repeat protein